MAEANTIHVTGFDRGTTEAELYIHFQSQKRSGGGDIADVKIHNNEATIIFEDSKVAERVLTREQFLKDRHLRLSREKIAQSAKFDTFSYIGVEQSSSFVEQLNTIEVCNIASITTKNGLEKYFRNARRSGGGEIEMIRITDDRKAFVSFKKSSVAQRVADQKLHEFDGEELTVRLFRGAAAAACFDPYSSNAAEAGNRPSTTTAREIPKDVLRVFVKGLNPTVTRDELTNHMEIVSGHTVEDIRFGDGHKTALVLFDDQPDFDEISRQCRLEKLEGMALEVEAVPVCQSVLVSGIKATTTRQELLDHFQNSNPEVGGGAVEQIMYDPGTSQAEIKFRDYSVVESIYNNKHILSSKRLNVKRYYPCLGEVKVQKTREQAIEEKTPTLAYEFNVDHCVMDYVVHFQAKRLQAREQKCCLRMQWTPGSSKIYLTPTQDMREIWGKWEEPCRIFERFIKEFVKESLTVSHEIWETTGERLMEFCSAVNVLVKPEQKSKYYLVDFFGVKEDVEDNVEEFRNIVVEAKKTIAEQSEPSKMERGYLETAPATVVFREPEQKEVIPSVYMEYASRERRSDGENVDEALEVDEIVMPNFHQGRYFFLQQSDYVKNLLSRYESLKLDIQPSQTKIKIEASKHILPEVKYSLLEKLASIKETEVPLKRELSEAINNPICHTFIQNHLSDNSIEAILVFNEVDGKQTPIIVSSSKEDERKSMSLLSHMTIEKHLALKDGQIKLLSDDKWMQFLCNLRELFPVNITVDEARGVLHFAGIKEHVNETFQCAKDFLISNNILTHHMPLSDGHRRILSEHNKEVLSNIMRELRRESVQITFTTSGIDIEGTAEGVFAAKDKIDKIVEDIFQVPFPLESPAARKLFSSDKGRDQVQLIENKYHCVIKAESKGGSPRTPTSRMLPTNGRMLCSVTYEGKKISVYKGDLIKHKVDVMMNEANRKLQHDSGLALAMVRAGGSIIQEECNRYIEQNAEVLEGGFVATNAGALPCKSVIHAVSPRWSNEANEKLASGEVSNEERFLQNAIITSLQHASQKYVSVALPALGAGLCGFPRKVSARNVVETVIEFTKKQPGSCLVDVRLVDRNEATAEALAGELRRCLGGETSYTEGGGELLSKVERLGPKQLRTPNGLIVKFKKGDLSKESADVLVNTTSADFDFSKNACAKALNDAAGPDLLRQCRQHGNLQIGEILQTSGGDLYCHVFHVTCSRWENGKGANVLRQLIRKCLEKASERRFSTIAFPAIGTGNLEFPRTQVAEIFIDETVNFSSRFPASSLREVRIVVYERDSLTTQAFVDTFQSGGSFGVVRPSLRFKDKPLTARTAENIAVVLKPGNLAEEEADALVCSTSVELDLQSNACAKALSDAAGSTLQSECNAQKTEDKKLKDGDIVVTTGGKLKCKAVFHAMCSACNEGDGEEVLRSLVQTCLNKAQTNGYSTIAFPAIGTGNLNYPRERVAEIFLDEICSFSRNTHTRTRSVDEIRIVVYPKDMKTVEAFWNEFQENTTRDSTGEMTLKAERSRRRKHGSTRKQTSFGSVSMEIIHRDITTQRFDAVAAISDQNLKLKGAVGDAIFDKGGDDLKRACQEKGEQQTGTVVRTEAGGLPSRYIYHLITHSPDLSQLKEMIIKCLRQAENDGLNAIGMPALGTGGLGLDPSKVAKMMSDAVQVFSQENPVSLRKIFVVVFQADMVSPFMNIISNASTRTGPSFAHRVGRAVVSFLTRGSSTAAPHEDSSEELPFDSDDVPDRFRPCADGDEDTYVPLCLNLFAMTQRNATDALDDVRQFVQKSCKVDEIANKEVAGLTVDETCQIESLGHKNGVQITIENRLQRITVRGLDSDLLEVRKQISQLLNQKSERKRRMEQASLLFDNVNWCYKHDGKYVPYSKETNFEIEEAYTKRKTTFRFHFDNEELEIDFNSNREKNVINGFCRPVDRRFHGLDTKPDTWDAQPPGKDMHVVKLCPVENSAEYNMVTKKISKTAKLKIITVERIQNPKLYQPYRSYMMRMKVGGSGEERWVFHGTSKKNCESINKTGLDRAYAGINAACYGNGVYFARDASYSTNHPHNKFCPADEQGRRYLYLARLVCGRYTQGKEGIKGPPLGYDSAVDDPKNPSIFVAFKDYHYYVEYLIIFTD